MKKRKWLLTALAAASALACAVGFAACGDNTTTPPPSDKDQADNTDNHAHSWASDWSKDGVSHWHACSGCTDKKDKASHDFTNGACVCGITPSVGFTPEESTDGGICIKDMGTCTDSDIIIPSTINGKPVTAIAPMAFSGNTALKSIALPASVTSIGAEAFKDCTSLTSVSVAQSAEQTASAYASAFAAPFADTEDEDPEEPESDSVIGDSAFEGCTSLVSIEIPYGITSIGYLAFYNCTALASVLIPDSVTIIGMLAFNYCSSLTEIAIPKSVTYILPATFSYCSSLTSINVDENNESFSSENGILYNKDKTKIKICPEGIREMSFSIPTSVTEVEDYAFYGCSSLTSITIPDGVTAIYNCAFNLCTSLVSITIPKSVTTIGEVLFVDCKSLKSITVDKNNQNYISQNNALYNKDKTTLMCVPAGIEATTFSIPETVTEIEDYAISGCTSLTSIVIPDSVTDIGYCAFKDCTSLTSITVDENNQNYASQDGILYNKNKTTLMCVPAGIKATTYSIPDSVTRIDDDAFGGCTSLTSVVIPASVTQVYSDAFSGCTSLTSITVDENNQNYASQDGILYNKNKTTLMCVPAGIKATTYSIPDSVTRIDSDAFSGCTSLTSVVIPASVTEIGSFVFENCTSLTSITFEGTRAQWQAIIKSSSYWDENMGDYTVHCSDD